MVFLFDFDSSKIKFLNNVLDEEATEHSSGVRQSARIAFNDHQLLAPPRGKKAITERVVEGQIDKAEGKISLCISTFSCMKYLVQ